jgi:hypothetical protein
MVLIRKADTPEEYIDNFEVMACGDNEYWRIPLVVRYVQETFWSKQRDMRPDVSSVRRIVRSLAEKANVSEETMSHKIAIQQLRREATNALIKRIKGQELTMSNVMKVNREITVAGQKTTTVSQFVLSQLANTKQMVDIDEAEHSPMSC